MSAPETLRVARYGVKERSGNMRTNLRLVRIDWLDARSLGSGWKLLTKAKKMRIEKCVSVGFIVNETKHTITIVASLTKIEQMCDGDVIIPKGWITKIKELS